MGATTTSYPGEGDWLKHQNMIRYEYLVKDTSLKDLVMLLRAQGLHITKGQLEYKLKSWKLSKNIDKETWQYIDRKIRKRKDEGKDSDVTHYGKRLKKSKVTKETNRHRETNIFARFRTPPPSPTNLHLRICTPPALQMSSNWPSSLPWIILQNNYWNIATPNVTASKDVTLQQRHLISTAISMVMSMLRFGNRDQSITLSKLIATVKNAIPEYRPGEHEETVQTVLAGHSFKSAFECFRIMVYIMSNSMLALDNSHLDFIIGLMENGTIDILVTLKNLRSENPTIRAFFEKLFHLAIREATSGSGSSVDLSKSLDRIKWLLELGMDPNCCCDIPFNTPATPIQQAVNAGALELLQLLLRFNVQPSLGQAKSRKEELVNLALEGKYSDAAKIRIMKFLFHHSFLSKEELLRAAIELGDITFMFEMLQYGPDVASYKAFWLPAARRKKWNMPHIFPYFVNPSALMMAIQAGGRMADLMLQYIMLKGQLTTAILADVYIATAYGGHYALMMRLDQTYTYEIICNIGGITPLQAAVVGGNPNLCRYLLERHGGSSTSLILVAAILGNVDIVQLLIEYGGDPNGTPCTEENKWYDYFSIPKVTEDAPRTMLTMLMHHKYDNDSREGVCLVLLRNGANLYPGDVAELSRHCYHRCLEAALMAGGNPNDEDSRGHTAIQCALNHFGSSSDDNQASKRLFTVELLIQAGASLIGGEVVRAIDLREMDLVLFLLSHGGTLTDLDETGEGCFEAEINAQNDPFLRDTLELHDFPIDAGPFCAAIHAENWELVGRLFEKTHKPTDYHILEGTAVGLAAEAGQLDIIQRLLTRFTHPSVLASAILPFRFDDGEIENISRFRNGSGYWRTIQTEGSPLALAAIGGHTRCFRELVLRGCSIDKITWTMIANSKRSSDYLEVLREFGYGLGTLRPYDSEFMTAMCKAIEAGKGDLLRYLVEVGAVVNEFDTSIFLNCSPLQCALLNDNIDMASYLLENGANINAPPAFNSGATALQFAATGGHIGFVSRLLQLGARVNTRGAAWFGRSALEAAAEYGKLDILALLVHHGAVAMGSGRQQLIIAVALAQKMAHHVAAEWLKENFGWTDTDQHLLERYNECDDYNRKECIRLYCCDEYHDSDSQCTYHYTEEQRNSHFEGCERCEELRDDRDDGSETSFSSEDEDSDSEGNED